MGASNNDYIHVYDKDKEKKNTKKIGDNRIRTSGSVIASLLPYRCIFKNSYFLNCGPLTRKPVLRV